MTELSETTKEAIRLTVRETLLTMGLNIESSEDMMELQADFQHLRAFRKATQAATNKSMLAVLATLVTGFLAATWMGIQQMLQGGNN